ncbi:MAG TPA: CBS domain-containing protein [Gillisia sp.]|nr:CBS domain-containing protein [Gillisia sp.]
MGKSPHTGTVSKEEYIALTDAAVEEGVFSDKETTFIQNILKFKSIKAQNIMTPFSVASIAEENMTIKEFYESQEELIFSRIPIYETTPNHVTGLVLKDEVLEKLIENNPHEPLKSIKKEISIVAKETPITELFEKFIKDKAHMAVLVDDYGHTVGLVTMEDVIETLLGLEIMDESDNVEDMQILARQNWERRAKRMGILGPKIDGKE